MCLTLIWYLPRRLRYFFLYDNRRKNQICLWLSAILVSWWYTPIHCFRQLHILAAEKKCFHTWLIPVVDEYWIIIQAIQGDQKSADNKKTAVIYLLDRQTWGHCWELRHKVGQKHSSLCRIFKIDWGGVLQNVNISVIGHHRWVRHHFFKYRYRYPLSDINVAYSDTSDKNLSAGSHLKSDIGLIW
jgi:hypothetical protein